MAFDAHFFKLNDAEAQLRAHVHSLVFNEIITWALQGQLSPEMLEERHGLPGGSTLTVLGRLVEEGIVVRAKDGSFFVRRVETAEYVGAVEVRSLLEGEAAWRAAGRVPLEKIETIRHRLIQATPEIQPEAPWRLDEDFHELIAEECGNVILTRNLRQLRVICWLFQPPTNSFMKYYNKDREKTIIAEHLDILDSLQRGCAEASRESMQAHVNGNYLRKLGYTISGRSKANIAKRDSDQPHRKSQKLRPSIGSKRLPSRSAERQKLS